MLAGSCGSPRSIFMGEGRREGRKGRIFFAVDMYRNPFEPQSETNAMFWFIGLHFAFVGACFFTFGCIGLHFVFGAT